MDDIGEARGRYLRLMEKRPDLFTSDPTGIRLVTEARERMEVEARTMEKMRQRGLPETYGQAGYFYEDAYMAVVRDAVIFPDGQPGIHHRVLTLDAADPITGVALLPMINGEIVLIRHYRHAVGGWCWEIPRGGIALGQQFEEAARLELFEEIGATASELIRLGTVNGMSGLIRGKAALILARLDSVGAASPGEGITEIRRISPQDFERMVLADEIEDGFALSAFLHARLGGHL